MFAQQLQQFRQGSQSPKSHSPRRPSQPLSYTSNNLQYQICSTFLKHTGQKLLTQESSLMQTSQQFIDLYATFKKKDIDSSRTLDTMMQQGKEGSVSMDEDHSFSLPRSKSPQISPRRGSHALNEQLREIKERCSYTCFAFINNLVAEYKALQSRLRFIQNRESLSTKHDKGSSRFHQENLILRKKNQLQQLKIHEMQDEIEILKEKNRSICSTVNNKNTTQSNPYKYFQINNKVYRDIKNFLQEKENVLKKQTEKIGVMENEVMRGIERVFEEDSCLKCCDILRKLKESILRFRKYLQGESIEFEKLYDKYKRTMYSTKSRPSL